MGVGGTGRVECRRVGGGVVAGRLVQGCVSAMRPVPSHALTTMPEWAQCMCAARSAFIEACAPRELLTHVLAVQNRCCIPRVCKQTAHSRACMVMAHHTCWRHTLFGLPSSISTRVAMSPSLPHPPNPPVPAASWGRLLLGLPGLCALSNIACSHTPRAYPPPPPPHTQTPSALWAPCSQDCDWQLCGRAARAPAP